MMCAELSSVGFNSLPTEIQLLIISHLSHNELETVVAPVCKQWDSLAYDPLLWKKLTLDRTQSATDLLVKRWNRVAYLRELTLIYFKHWEWLFSIVGGNKLDRFEFRNCIIDKDCVSVMVLTLNTRYPFVKHLLLRNCKLSDEFYNVATRWEKLKIISVNNCKDFDKKLFFLHVVQFCHDLEKLSITSHIISRFIQSTISAECFVLLCEQLPCVKLCKLILNGNIFNDEELRIITEKCSLIKKLEISWNSNITDAGVVAVVDNLRFLEILRLSYIKNITKSDASSYLKHFSDLKVVEICWMV